MESRSTNILFPDPRFNIDVLQQLEIDLLLEEKISLIFLLYDDVPVAQERIFLTFRAYQESTTAQSIQMDLLHEWAVKSGPFWKEKLVEGLLILKAYSNIRKLGLDKDLLRKHFLPDCLLTSLFIHPMKKVLYSVCESLDGIKTKQLVVAASKNIPTLNLEKLDYEYFEYFLLKLIRNNFIQLGSWKIPNDSSAVENFSSSNIQNFVSILNELKFDSHTADLLFIENHLNKTKTQSEPLQHMKKVNKNIFPEINHHNEISNLFKKRAGLKEDNAQEFIENNFENTSSVFKSSSTSTNKVALSELSNSKEYYPINYSDSIGLFIIINQEEFSNSHRPELTEDLERRIGSNKDVERLTKTWKSLGFRTLLLSNLNYHDTLFQIRIALRTQTSQTDSIFGLCFLSHGVKGAVYAADGVKIEVQTIEQLLYASEAPELAQKPKLIFIQSCQGEDKLGLHNMKILGHNLVQDGPSSSHRILEKSDILVFWSTVPNYASYRDTNAGSWFIQCLCDHLDGQHKGFDFVELCICVNNEISQKKFGPYGQMSEITTCFRKSLILKKIL